MKKISIGSWAFNIGPYAEKPIPFETVCHNLKEQGFDGVELGGFNSYPNPENHPTKAHRDELIGKMKNWGLEFSGFAADLWSQKLINTDDQTEYINTFTRNADFARDLGIKGIRVDCTQPPIILNEVDYDTAFQRVVNTWKKCADIAADRGLYVTWEFEPGFAFNKPSDIVKVHDAVDKSNFGIMYDTCHGQMVSVVGARQYGKKETLPGGQLEFIKMLSGRINHIHMIDSDNTCHKAPDGSDETSAHPPFGEGILNFDELAPALAKEKVGQDWWTIDLCFYPEAWENTAKCKQAIDKLNAKYGTTTAVA